MADILDSSLFDKTTKNNTDLPALSFGFEMVVPNVRQRTAKAISPTKSMWSAWSGRSNDKEQIERHDVSFNAIRRMMAIDGYVKAAVAKYINSIFLRGYTNYTLSPEIEKYMKLRLQMIIDAMPDHNHLDDFYQAIARDLVAYANVYLVKIRNKPGKMPKGVKEFKGVKILKYPNNDKKNEMISQEPIAAYELLHPASIHIIRDKETGKLIRYEQWPINAKQRPTQKKDIRKWDPWEMIHIVMDREDGYPYGIPSLDAVLDDVRIFRNMEDCASRLAYRYAFPFTQVKVGLPQPGFQASEEDIKFYRELVQNAPPDATIVTNERVEFAVVGVQGEALQLDPYLEHFKNRLFSGLQVSAVAMGEGDTANRATADALTVEMHDQIKHYQNILARNISAEIYRELLLEAGWDWYDDPEKNWCNLQFNEIELEAQIKRETHVLNLVQGNLLSITEGRQRLGEQPFTKSEWKDSYLWKVLLPQDMVKASGSPDPDSHQEMVEDHHDADIKQKKAETEQTKAQTLVHKRDAAQPPEQADGPHKTTTNTHAVTTGGGKRTVKKTTQVKEPVGPKAGAKSTAKGTSFKIRAANQHGRRSGPKRASESELLSHVEVDVTIQVDEFHEMLCDIYTDFSYEVLRAMSEHLENPKSSQDIPGIVDFVYSLVAIRINSLSEQYLKPAFGLGWDAFEAAEDHIVPQTNFHDQEILVSYNKANTYRLIGDISEQIERQLKNIEDPSEARLAINNILGAHEYRLQFMANSELIQAFWFGYSSAALEVYKKLLVIPSLEESQCEICAKKAGTILTPSMSPSMRLSQVPVYHPNCNCVLVPESDEETETNI